MKRYIWNISMLLILVILICNVILLECFMVFKKYMVVCWFYNCLLFSKIVIDDNCFLFDGVMGWFNVIERWNDYVIVSFY